MGYALKDNNRKYFYKDYLMWPDHERWEIINGVAYNMSPAPSREHQRILLEIAGELRDYLKGKSCEVYIAPFDVRLGGENTVDEEIDTVVQPDIIVVCDKKKLDNRGCRGAPDLIIEILSPYTAGKDIKEKFLQYEYYKVKEYWIVSPEEQTLMVFTLNNTQQYGRPDAYDRSDRVKVGIFEDLFIDLSAIFKTEENKKD